jgi:hypothetical protein
MTLECINVTDKVLSALHAEARAGSHEEGVFIWKGGKLIPSSIDDLPNKERLESRCFCEQRLL